MKSYLAKKNEVEHVAFVDAEGQVLGRLAVIAMALMGKDKPVYTCRGYR